ncbi:MAG: hypothetical protein IK062_09295 [Selenomonadaceae bacterium]|nr:hypothetical protein [Selenomonadaceae bacterium]
MKDEKILQDELMTDEELKNVYGGTCDETYSDVDNFEALGIKVYCREPGIPVNDLHTWTMMNLYDEFNRFGVNVEAHNDDSTPNKYFIGEKNVSREEVWKYIKSKI